VAAVIGVYTVLAITLILRRAASTFSVRRSGQRLRALRGGQRRVRSADDLTGLLVARSA
jgi:hypothetical protein